VIIAAPEWRSNLFVARANEALAADAVSARS
jgi:hypothetical protein